MQKVLIVCLLFLSTPLWAKEELYFIAPSQLPNTSREMHSAGFWINQHPNPDQLILFLPEIREFNRELAAIHLIEDIFDDANVEALKAQVQAQIRGAVTDFRTKDYRLANGEVASKDFFENVDSQINVDSFEPQAKWGLIVHYAHQRFLPTNDGLYAKAFDVDFDELQNSALDTGTPVIVWHESLDGHWVFVQSEASWGWIQKDNVAIGSKDDVKQFAQSQQFIIVVQPKADVYLNEQKIKFYDSLQMGTRLPFIRENAYGIEIMVPQKDSKGNLILSPGYMNTEDIHLGYLKYTPRTILIQAFKMLYQPYGWGGMYGEQDCSRFLQQVFGSVGIKLPRDSKNQAKVPMMLAEFNESTTNEEKISALKKAMPATSILPMKGHIMLYLGMIDDRAYAIHATWAYRQRINGVDTPRVLNQVVVSDLSLGETSQKGSLLKRLSAIKALCK